MENKAVFDLKRLQRSAPGDQAIHLRHVLTSNPGAVSSLTSELITLVASDLLPSIALSLWPMAANDPTAIVAVMHQELCLNAQRSAIRHFYRHLRREKTFAKAWEAVGGASGVAQLAAKLNLNHVRLLFSLLGDAGRARGARKERQRAMEELLTLLWGDDGEASASAVGTDGGPFDSRPLRDDYVKLIPACSGAFRVEWQEMKRQLPERYSHFVTTDQEFFEHYYNEKLRRGEITASDFLHEIKPLAAGRIDYGLHILHKFAESETLLGASPSDLLKTIFDPLGKRLLSNRMISSDVTLQFWSRVVSCLKERQAFRGDFDNSAEHYRRLVARLFKVWNRSRAKAEYTDMLATLFSILPQIVVNRYNLVELVRKPARSLRYRLLRLFLKNTGGYQFDIGEPDSLDHTEFQKSTLRWPARLFFELSAKEALSLFIKVRRAGNYIAFAYGHTFYFERRDADDWDSADHHIVQALLLNRNPAALPSMAADLEAMRSEIRLQELPERMKKATQGRSPEARSLWCAAALSLCIAIGDLDLLAETLRWARRFNKDPLALKEMYSQSCISRHEGISLLAVLHFNKDTPLTMTLEQLTKNIRSANEILQTLFETAIMAANEPSFDASNWQATLGLIRKAISRRLNWINDFQDRCEMSDDALFVAVWEPTLTMLKEMISTLLGPAGERFKAIDAYATVSWRLVSEPETMREPTIRFLNALAVFHDSIWAERRMLETPAIVTAGEIWPKGLAIQHLSDHFGMTMAYLPYTRSRIESIVYMDAHKAMASVQVDEETQAAIGEFIDSGREALRLYIRSPRVRYSKSPTLKDFPLRMQRQERITKAWKYATVNLSKGRMSLEEAERFWWPVFSDGRINVERDEVGIDESANQRPEPSLPEDDEDMHPTEWNPDPDYNRLSQPEKSKSIAPTYLDVLLSQSPETTIFYPKRPSKSSAFDAVKAVIPGKPRPCSFWQSAYTTGRKLTGRGADAYVTAGILALNMKYGSDVSLLKTPFPGANTARIPAVYLDEEFLEREAAKDTQIHTMVTNLSSYVPTRLLARLAASVLESIRKKPESEKPYKIFSCIIDVMLEGINPSLAFPLIQQFVLEYPSASAWHRLLLSPQTLMSFLPSDAKKFFESFTDAILDRLQAQAERRAEEPDSSESKGPLVKITTVKMLAQLLRECPVVDSSFAVDLNIRILERATHVDIRIASIRALTEALSTTTSPVVKQRIFDALFKHAAPMASSVHEAQPAVDWDALKPGDELPEIWGDGSGNFWNPPIVDVILLAGREIDLQSDQGRTLTKLKNFVLDSSAENNRRWTNLFLKKNGFSVPDNAQLPPIPVFPTALNTLLVLMQSETSLKYIDLMKRYTLMKMNPPDWLARINKAVKDDRDLSRSNAGKHWYNLWSSDSYTYMTNTLGNVSVFLGPKNPDTRDREQSRAFYESLEQFIYEVGDAFITEGLSSQYLSFLDKLSWMGPESPVWRRLVDRINSLRTPAWQADPNRKPKVLPDTLPLKMKMLNLPKQKLTNPDEAKTVMSRCVNGVIELLDEFVSSGTPYFERFNTLQNELGTVEPMAEMAILLGSEPARRSANEVTLVDHLRLDLAINMMNRSNVLNKGLGKAHDEDVINAAAGLVVDMSNSHVEYIRTLAAPLKNGLENDTGFNWWD
ncbi:hypothetical protein TRIATDRAFT_282697 [Trichoderma atroviride IMI 206040]|uniref:Uncharacterized protein n=1 Tax=Hypocrea atroviridis (strain ATCC 20476 / IMI 206040) TaxID=452589 RepID=G9NQA0_HYPAI|nr:uncharacterized protein TRIATDRAFT_282697 [Trichoderma atroviride IMI 206040]EHK47245.1 hypothetical protein TRIATDRAFT_282697 [Trichoderma atroviride IMI 206040]